MPIFPVVAESEEAVEKAIYHPLEPAFVVNLSSQGKRQRFLQVSIQLMTRDSGMIKIIEFHDPAVRHTLLMLYSNQDMAYVQSSAGKMELRQKVLENLQTLFTDVAGKPGIEAVYITDYVIQ